MIKRRTLLTAAGAAAGLSLSGCAPSAPELSTTPKTYVLVHGAWHGGWCWKYVRKILQEAGHQVFTPTLSGLGERAHLISAEIGLDTHIEDVVRHILSEELTDIILVGHSYGGMVITGVVDRVKDRVSHIVYLDAGLPDDGDSFATQAPDITPETAAAAEAQMKTFSKDGVVMDVFSPVALGIPATDTTNLEWVGRHMTPHPLKTWLDPIVLKNGGSADVARTYIHCNAPALGGSSFFKHYALLEKDQSWNTYLLATGHDAMVTAPVELSEILLTL